MREVRRRARRKRQGQIGARRSSDAGEANARRDVRRSISARRPIGRIGQQSNESSAGNRDGSVGRVDGVHDTTPSWESKSNQQKNKLVALRDARICEAHAFEMRRLSAMGLPLRIALTVRAYVRAIEGSVRVAGKGKSLGQLLPESFGIAPDERGRFVIGIIPPGRLGRL
jgi:hypothetical protein